MAAVVVCAVVPFWLIGTNSVPVIGPAEGSSEIRKLGISVFQAVYVTVYRDIRLLGRDDRGVIRIGDQRIINYG